MTGTVRLHAQAKVNLRLKVFALGESGYHAIETVFQRLALADLVTVSASAGEGTDLDMVGDPALVAATGDADRNLALVAARSYLARSAWDAHVSVRIQKSIPVGAGLGGGSADAAAVLRGLDALAPSPLPAADLLELACTIGSDVPFLLSDDVLSIGWGRGERLLPLPALPPRPVLLGIPAAHVSTMDAYSWLGRARGAAPGPPELPADAFVSWESAAGHAENDFEPVVSERLPMIPAIRASFTGRGARISMLTGSGAAVFGVFDPNGPGVPAADTTQWREIRTATAAHVVPLERLD
ncbi:MAG: hypothetical protein H0W42_08435 [Gemmatimonadaceae bacterium]|nr:hypothetical protein [Gemmatimonadaceae bacterium]